MATPTDLQNATSAIQWTNGRQLVTGAMVSGLFAIVIAILSGMGTWSTTGFTPNIPAGTITGAMLAPGTVASNLGAASGAVTGNLPGPLALAASGVTAGSYGAANSSLSAAVGADGRLTALAAQPIAVASSQITDLAANACSLAGCALTGALGLPATTVAALPACGTATKDAIRVVSDATSPTYRGAPAGGGAVRTLVECDGSAWTTH